MRLTGRGSDTPVVQHRGRVCTLRYDMGLVFGPGLGNSQRLRGAPRYDVGARHSVGSIVDGVWPAAIAGRRGTGATFR